MEKFLLNIDKQKLLKSDKLCNKFNYSNKLDLSDKLEFQENALVLLQGRITFIRRIGQITFIDLYALETDIQLIFNVNTIDYGLLLNLDISDIIYVKGSYTYSLTSEESVSVKEWQIITKCLINIPDKHSKLSSPELIYKNRYLLKPFVPLIFQNLKTRFNIIKLVRLFFYELGYIEADIPLLSTRYGGALAKPFTTHMLSEKYDLYLSISPELELKELIAGGFNNLFCLTHNFRNEGIDKTHYPEFSAIEAYSINKSYIDMFTLLENLIKHIAIKLDKKIIVVNDISINLMQWRVSEFDDLVFQYFKKSYNLADIKVALDLEKISYSAKDVVEFEEYKLLFFDKVISKNLIQPTHVINLPLSASPLAKRLTESTIQQCDSYINGIELSTMYSEENNPLQIIERLSKSQSFTNSHFIDVVSYGIPVLGGIGIGLQRLIMLFTEEKNIINILPFPNINY